MFSNNYLKVFIGAIFLGSFFSVVSSVEAVEISAVADRLVVHKGEVLIVPVTLDTKGEVINAISGSVSVDPSILKPEQISTDTSIVNMWVVKPHIEDNTVVWSGVTPNGFSGVRSPFYTGVKPGLLFTVAYRVIGEGNANIAVQNTESYIADGRATPAVTSGSNMQVVSMAGSADKTYVSLPEKMNKRAETHLVDSAPSLYAQIARDSSVANNKWFVSFNDTSGTDIEYAVAESDSAYPDAVSASEWKQAVTPYILSDQSRQHYVHVRSIARDGSEQFTTFPPQNTSSSTVVWVIIALGIVCLFALRFLQRKWQKK